MRKFDYNTTQVFGFTYLFTINRFLLPGSIKKKNTANMQNLVGKIKCVKIDLILLDEDCQTICKLKSLQN